MFTYDFWHDVGLPISARVETTKLECPVDRLFLINLAVACMLLDTVQAYLDSQPFGILSLLYSTPASKTTTSVSVKEIG